MNESLTSGGPRLGLFLRLSQQVRSRKALLWLLLAALAAASFSLFLDIWLAVALCISIGWHEYGHLWQAKREGMKTRGFILLPFLGGVAFADGRFPSGAAEVRIALAGPFFGFLLMSASLCAFVVSGDPFFGKVALLNGLINLFNLLPIYPLDGGRVFRALTFGMSNFVGEQFHLFSTVLATGLFLLLKSPVLLLVVYLTMQQYLGVLRERRRGDAIAGALRDRRAAVAGLLKEHLLQLGPSDASDRDLNPMLAEIQGELEAMTDDESPSEASPMMDGESVASAVVDWSDLRLDRIDLSSGMESAPECCELLFRHRLLQACWQEYRQTVLRDRAAKAMSWSELTFGLLAFAVVSAAFAVMLAISVAEPLFHLF